MEQSNKKSENEKKKKSTIEKQVMHSGKISGKIESVVFQQSYLEYVLHICIHGLSRKKKKKKKAHSFIKSITIVSV